MTSDYGTWMSQSSSHNLGLHRMEFFHYTKGGNVFSLATVVGLLTLNLKKGNWGDRSEKDALKNSCLLLQPTDISNHFRHLLR